MGQRPCSGGPSQEPPGTSPASVEEAVREAVVGFRRIGGRGTRAASAGPSLGDPAFPGRRAAQSLSSPPKLPRQKGRSRARAPAEKFTVIVSQKTLAGKREARATSPGRDSMHAWPLSQFHSVCVLHGRVKMDWTELDWTRTGRGGGQNSEGRWWWCRRWWLFLSTP